jgi:hypothetical protein
LFCLFVNVCLFVMFRARHRAVRRLVWFDFVFFCFCFVLLVFVCVSSS